MRTVVVLPFAQLVVDPRFIKLVGSEPSGEERGTTSNCPIVSAICSGNRSGPPNVGQPVCIAWETRAAAAAMRTKQPGRFTLTAYLTRR